MLRVSDNSPGVDAALAQQLQQRWAQGDQGQRLGAGLGLAIVARHVQLMEGRLELAAASDTGDGSGLAASVWLPLAPSASAPSSAPPTSPSRARPTQH